MTTVISVEHLSKSYRLGQIGTGTFAHDLNVWWAKVRGKPNPLLRIGETDHGNRDGEIIWALKDVSFTVEQGEVLGIIGRNGAGKSTLLKILSRITAPTEGVVKVRGRIASLLEVGTGFHPELTGRENIYLNGAILGMSRKEIDRKFDEIVAFAEIEPFIDTPVKRYSSGMYVRLAFAVAAHLDAEILMVDEVLAVGDAAFQKKCLGKMGDVASQEGRTVLFVSHNMGAIKSLCNRVILFDVGKCILDGDTSKVVDFYFSNQIRQLEKTPVIQVSSEQRIRGNGSVKISQIEIRDEFGEFRNRFRVWEPFVVCLRLEVIVEHTSASCWLLIIDQEDRVVLSTFQYDEMDLVKLRRGIYQFTVKIDTNVLTPGSYSISAGVFGHHNEFYEWVDKVISLTIEEQLYPSKAFDGRLGIVTVRSKWQFNKFEE